jgi:D-glycerate 3-kinase
MMNDQTIEAVLKAGLSEQTISDAQWQRLADWELADPDRANAWGIDDTNVRQRLQRRFDWLQRVAPRHSTMPLPPQPIDHYLGMYWQLWLPLALQLKQARDAAHQPLIQGILGGQGTGKTTLTQILQILLVEMGYRAVGLSIDDLYKTYAERCQLRQQDARLKWRGPPGTHDIDLGVQTLDQIRHASPETVVYLPRFDKSLHGGEGDRTTPEAIQGVDILLFEGWFLGVRPVPATQFNQAPPPIQSEADREFARLINDRLQDYLPLWDRLDRLLVLYPEDYRISKTWRLQAEHQMKAQGKTGMSDEDIHAFVEYFWKALHPELFITPLKHNGDYTDLVVEINLDRTPHAIYAPT